MSHVMRVLTACCLVLALGCHRNKDAEGPMERAGKSVDRAAEQSERELRKAAEKTSEVAERAATATGIALEKAGKKLKGEDAPAPPPAK